MIDPSVSADWEKDVMQKMLFASIKEHRRARRWGIFFKGLFFAYLILMTAMLWPSKTIKSLPKTHTALVDVSGVIREEETRIVFEGLRRAFEASNAKSIILRINSPGGSSVQAGYIYDEIVRLRKKHPDKFVYSVITDIAASGGYYIAAAADYIYAYPTSLVGNIGAVMPMFGFVDSMKILGVEQRSITAGKNKLFLDPFSPEKPEQKAFAEKLLTDVHQTFIQAIKEGRGDRIKGTPEMFSGLIWTGTQALELGLIDGLGNAGFVAREVVGVEHIVNYTPVQSFFDRVMSGIGVSFANQFMTNLGIRKPVVQ